MVETGPLVKQVERLARYGFSEEPERATSPFERERSEGEGLLVSEATSHRSIDSTQFGRPPQSSPPQADSRSLPWLNHWKRRVTPSRLAFLLAIKPGMKRYLPFVIIVVVFVLAGGAGALLYRFRKPPSPPPIPTFGSPGAEPPHVRGLANAPVSLEEFGDFECLPCFRLWPALKNIENEYPKTLAITFREHPLAQHPHARDAARAAEAAGLQGHFWEMYDFLYLRRAEWVRSEDVRASFIHLASDLKLDLDRFTKDMDGEEVAKRIATDEDRGASLGIDRTPVIFINGKKIELSADPEETLRTEIKTVLGGKKLGN